MQHTRDLAGQYTATDHASYIVDIIERDPELRRQIRCLFRASVDGLYTLAPTREPDLGDCERTLRTVETGSRPANFEAPMVHGEYSGDEFTLDDTLRVGTFSLEEALEARPIILAFFPGTYTPVCWDEMREFQATIAEFEELGVDVYGISVDTPFAQNKFIDDCDLHFPLVSDHDEAIIEQFGVVYDDFSELEPFGYEYDGYFSIAKRSIFALDRDGVVTYKWVSETPMGLPDIEEIKLAAEDVA